MLDIRRGSGIVGITDIGAVGYVDRSEPDLQEKGPFFLMLLWKIRILSILILTLLNDTGEICAAHNNCREEYIAHKIVFYENRLDGIGNYCRLVG